MSGGDSDERKGVEIQGHKLLPQSNQAEKAFGISLGKHS